jgi:hypothetical protein
VLIAALAMASPSQAMSILRGFALNLDGQVIDAGGPIPSTVDLGDFDLATGLGVVRVEIAPLPGLHDVLAFFDHDIDAALNTFFNETGSAVGTPESGLTWEIDEPGFVLGDLYENFAAGQLDGGIGTSVYGATVFPDDVAFGLGWRFALSPGETAVVTFTVSGTAPSGFHLSHADPDSPSALYASSSLTIVPEPGTALLVGWGLFVAAAVQRRVASGREGRR